MENQCLSDWYDTTWTSLIGKDGFEPGSAVSAGHSILTPDQPVPLPTLCVCVCVCLHHFCKIDSKLMIVNIIPNYVNIAKVYEFYDSVLHVSFLLFVKKC